MMTDTTGAPGGAQLTGGTGAPLPPQPPEWATSYEEPIRTLAAAKGWATPADAVKSYADLERFHGANAAGRGVILPKDEADAEGWNKVWTKLGRPEAPDGYALEKITGLDPEFAKDAAKEFHTLGVPAKQAQALASWYTTVAAKVAEQGETAFATQASQQMDGLKREWGGEFEQRQAVARQAVRQFLGAAKMTPDGQPDPADPVAGQLNMLERAWGTKAMYEFFYRLGSGLGEGRLATGNTGGMGGGATTRDAALAELDALKKDEATKKKWMDGDKDVVARMNRLYEVAYSGA